MFLNSVKGFKIDLFTCKPIYLDHLMYGYDDFWFKTLKFESRHGRFVQVSQKAYFKVIDFIKKNEWKHNFELKYLKKLVDVKSKNKFILIEQSRLYITMGVFSIIL